MTDENYTHLALVVDSSGSMQTIVDDVNGAIAQLLSDQAKEPGTLRVDVCTFDSVVEFVATDAAVADVPADLVAPRGGTALNDAIGLMILRLGNKFKIMPEEKRPAHVIVVIATDGMENSSREFSAAQVKAMVTEQTEKWSWTFVYLAANVDAFATGGAYGFAKGSTISVAGTGQSFQAAYGSTSNLVTRTRSGLSTEYTDEEREAAGTA
jgi:uncharacterized protein YegL